MINQYFVNKVEGASTRQKILMVYDKILSNILKKQNNENSIECLAYLIDCSNKESDMAENFENLHFWCMEKLLSNKHDGSVFNVISKLREGFLKV